MQTRGLFAAAAALLLGAGAALAGQTAGTFAYHNGLTTETKLPDGRKAIVLHYYVLFVSDKTDDPINNTAGDCVVNMIVSKESRTLSGSGICFPKDVHGDGASLWWKIDAAGTAECPDQCGSYGYVDGYGRFKGVTGSGTWVRTQLFSDGGMGTLNGGYLRAQVAPKQGAARGQNPTLPARAKEAPP